MSEENAYILGTDEEELIRLELQHEVWLSEAKHGWDLAEFKTGQTILDLGCGPGYCTEELAHIVGKTGKVIGVDRSDTFIAYLNQIKKLNRLSIEPCLADFDSLSLNPESLDGMYCRWALAWLTNPKKILAKVRDALKPGGRMVIQEYYQVSTFKTNPERPSLRKAIDSLTNHPISYLYLYLYAVAYITYVTRHIAWHGMALKYVEPQHTMSRCITPPLPFKK